MSIKSAWPFLLLAFAGGSIIPLQAAINARLGAALSGGIWGATASFIVGTVALIFFQLVRGSAAPTVQTAMASPWWIWLGGILGAFYVSASILSVREIGAASLIALVVCAQVLVSLVVDHFGLFGLSPQTLNLPKLAGAFLLLGGVLLIVRS